MKKRQTDVSDDVEQFHAANVLGQKVNCVRVFEGAHELHDKRKIYVFHHQFFLLFFNQNSSKLEINATTILVKNCVKFNYSKNEQVFFEVLFDDLGLGDAFESEIFLGGLVFVEVNVSELSES